VVGLLVSMMVSSAKGCQRCPGTSSEGCHLEQWWPVAAFDGGQVTKGLLFDW